MRLALARLARSRGRRQPHVAIARARRLQRRPDRADRRPVRAARSALRAGRQDAALARLDAISNGFSTSGSTSNCSATASTARSASKAELVDLAYRRGLPLVATNEPYFAAALRLRGARRAALHRRGRADQRRRTAASSRPSIGSRRAPKCARCSPICRRRLATSVEIAMRCAYRPRTRKPILPRFTSPTARRSTRSRELRRAGRGGLARAPRRAWPRAGRHRGRLPRAARLRARRHRQDEVPRLLPHRRRLHQMGEGAGHSGRAGPRLGRRLARRLGADHHRSRSDPLRPAVRALPQSRARVDAGFRHRLLPGPARRGDPLRARTLRRRPRRADHHLRLVPGARRHAQCRARARNAARPGRQARQAGAAESRHARHAQAGDRVGAAPARGGRGGPARRQHARRSPKSSKGSIPTPRPTPRASSSATGRSTNWCRSIAIRSRTCRRPSST